MIYAKCHQRGNFFNFYALDEQRVPIGVEVLCFLNAIPSISYNEYDVNEPAHQIEVDAIVNHYERITREAYRTAYALTTESDFNTYLPT